MGRLQPTIVAPQTNRRSDRAKRAKETVNKVIPDLLKSSPRARHGIHNAILTSDPKPVKDIDMSSTSNLTVRLLNTDSLTAARRLTHSSRRQSAAAAALATSKQANKTSNVCILNMASPLRPGGGFLEGATSSEEFLCMRTTLYASLWDDFYRLPEIGGIVTPDVLVHRDSTAEAEDLPKRERFFVDVISSAMIRFPETNSARLAEKEEAEGCSCGVSYCDRDRELVTHKMRGVLRMAQARGATKLILGAWGCGAYGNPVREVAKIWKRVLLGTTRKAESWLGIKEVVFAITDRGQLKEFEKCFGDVLTRESVSPPPEMTQASSDAGTQSPTSELISELVSKIQETELQLDQISNPRSKARLREVLAALNKQLSQAGSGPEEDEMPPDPIAEEEAEDTSYPGAAGGFEGEEGGYYNFDSSDIASSGSVSPSTSDIYEFRVPGASVPNKSTESHTPDDFEHIGFDNESGWFSGSINGLSSLLAKQRRGGSATSPMLRGQGGVDDVEPLGFGSGLADYLQRFAQEDEY